jgi:hypothetical protein
MIKKYLLHVNCAFANMAANNILKKAVFGILYFIAVTANAQEHPKDFLLLKFDTYRQQYLQEKIFVHTDKNFYLPGEICWFKIYNVDASFHKPLNLGKIAYIEIFDKKNTPVLQAKIQLQNGTGNGSFFIPASLSSGNYRLRAYTNWMKNFSPDYFFEKKLEIVNIQTLQPEDSSQQKAVPEINFFPEGGNLVNGIESKVGFKITNAFGKGIYFEGAIVNQSGDTITTFRPLKFGMGNFSLKPLQGEVYRAFIKLPDGMATVRELPSVYDNGYSMHLEHNNKGQIEISVQTPAKNNISSGKIYLFIQTRNVIKEVLSNTIKNGQADFLIEDAKAGDGISQFTVFNENRQPVCERLYFKNPAQKLTITATAEKKSYELRKKINLMISSAAETGRFTAADMSLAVYRLDSLTTTDEQDINNYLLLSADLSGTVESPGYYFLNNSDSIADAADNLMLTQGWRRFKWEEVLLNKKVSFRYLPEINGHIISGNITALQPALPLKNIETYLSAPGTRTQFQTASSDEEGQIKFEMKNFYTDGDIIAQTNTEKDSLYRVDINSPFCKDQSEKKTAPFSIAKNNELLLKRYIAAQVQNTYMYDSINKPVHLVLDTTAFYLKPDAVYLLDNYVRFTTLEEVLREYVPEVLVRRHGGRNYLPVFDDESKAPFDTDPLVLVDGVPVFNFNKLMRYDPLKIRKLEVINKTYYFGGNIFNGILNFSSYNGDIAGAEIDPRATVLDYEGLQVQREFYSPAYETSVQVKSHLPDFRNLLFWSPDIFTDESGKTQTHFYSSDVPGRYVVVVQGLTANGTAGAGVTYFEVKKEK